MPTYTNTTNHGISFETEPGTVQRFAAGQTRAIREYLPTGQDIPELDGLELVDDAPPVDSDLVVSTELATGDTLTVPFAKGPLSVSILNIGVADAVISFASTDNPIYIGAGAAFTFTTLWGNISGRVTALDGNVMVAIVREHTPTD
ncbi:MAG: hypothetical protein LBK59_08135 [Bifidobacteriaceae bacterium]|jgi:hypothetical protein|nr:hypothetical protein [Bifidobacteriaceae bacterium]